MEFFMKLPRNKKEFTLFMAVISVISVNMIAPLITCFEIGFSLAVWAQALKIMPMIWLCVIALGIDHIQAGQPDDRQYR